MPIATGHDEKELLRLVSQGDEAAFTALFDAYKDRIYSIALRLTGMTSIAEEVVQDIFLRIWLRRETLIGVGHFRAYLFTATRHLIFDTLKRLAMQRTLAAELFEPYAAETGSPDRMLLEKEYQSVLREAIAQLPPQQRRVYQLMKEQGLKREAVAEQLGISPQTVKVHLAQAMRSIRAFCLARLDIYIALVLFDAWRK